MKRCSAILLLLAFAAVASGALRFVHERAQAHAAHDEAHCVIHAMLKLPMLGPGHVPVLVAAGLFVAFLTAVPRAVRCRRPVLSLDPRGPPVVG